MPVKWVKIFSQMSEKAKAKQAAKTAAYAKVEAEVDAKEALAMKLYRRTEANRKKKKRHQDSPIDGSAAGSTVELLSDSDSESEDGDTPISSLKTISTDGYHSIFTPKSASSKPFKKKQKKTPGFQSALVLTSRNSSKAELELNLSITHFLAANSLPFAVSSLFHRIITRTGSVGSSYKMLSRQDVGGKYLDAGCNKQLIS
jgi:hypothetical protein